MYIFVASGGEIAYYSKLSITNAGGKKVKPLQHHAGSLLFSITPSCSLFFRLLEDYSHLQLNPCPTVFLSSPPLTKIQLSISIECSFLYSLTHMLGIWTLQSSARNASALIVWCLAHAVLWWSCGKSVSLLTLHLCLLLPVGFEDISQTGTDMHQWPVLFTCFT